MNTKIHNLETSVKNTGSLLVSILREQGRNHNETLLRTLNTLDVTITFKDIRLGQGSKIINLETL